MEKVGLFDVPFSRIEELPANSVAWVDTQLQSPSESRSGKYVNISELKHSQVRERKRYSQKLAKQLQSVGVAVDLESGLEKVDTSGKDLLTVEKETSIESQLSDSIIESDAVVISAELKSTQKEKISSSKFGRFQNIADETLSALGESMDLTDGCESLSEWDPMKASYELKSFNSYQEPRYNDDFMEKHTVVVSPDGSKKVAQDAVRLYISNIPLSLTQEGMLNLFSSVGKCKDVKKCRMREGEETTFGFVTYESVKEAENAICKYNGFVFGGKYKLKVKLAVNRVAPEEGILWKKDIAIDKKEGNENVNSSSDGIGIDEDCMINKVILKDDHIERERKAPSYAPFNKQSEYSKPSGVTPPRLYIKGLPVGTTELMLKDLFDEVGTSHSWVVVAPKKKDQSTTFGFVSFDDLEEAQLAIDVFDQYQFDSGHIINVIFTTETKKHFKIVNDDDEDFYDKLYEDFPPSSQINPCVGRNKAFGNFAGNENKFLPGDDPVVEKDIAKETSLVNAAGDPSNVKRPSCSDAVRGMMLKDLPAKPFPDESVFCVCVTEIESTGLIYGQLLNDESVNSLQELSTILKENYSDRMASFTPKINEMCVAKVEEDQCWYRASVMSYNADMTARVFFVDYGNRSDVDSKDIGCISEKLLNYPIYALKFSLVEISNSSSAVINLMKSLLLNKAATVTCVNIHGDIMDCQIVCDDGQDLAQALEPVIKKQQEADLISTGKLSKFVYYEISDIPLFDPVGKTFDILVTFVKDPSIFYGQIADINALAAIKKISEDLSIHLKTHPSPNFIPQIGGIYAGYHAEYEEWYRIVIIEAANDRATTRLLDYGEVTCISFENIRHLPSDASSLPIQAMPFSLSGYHQERGSLERDTAVLMENILYKKIRVNLVSKCDEVFQVDAFTEMGECLMNILQHCDSPTGLPSPKPFTKNPPDTALICMPNNNRNLYGKPPLVPIPDKCEVMIAYIQSVYLFYGQICDVDLANKSYEMTLAINDYCTNSNEKSYNPSINELCCGFDGDCWYRVIIAELKDDVAKAYFVDFGNHSHLNFNMLRSCPIEFVKMPSLAIPLKFYDSGLLVDSDENLDILKTKIENKIVTMHLIADKEIKEVKLFDENGVNIFESLLSISSEEAVSSIVVTPIEFRADCESKQITASTNESPITYKSSEKNIDIYTALPLLTITSKCQVMISYVESLTSFYGQVCEADLANKSYEMTLAINDYCTESNEKSYRPSLNELCCGFDVDCWYRVYIVELNDDNVKGYFIDYGNHSHLDFSMLRRCPAEFVKMPSLAIPLKMYNSKLLVDSDENLELLKTKIENKIMTIDLMSDNESGKEVKLFDESGSYIFESLHAVESHVTKSSVVNIPLNYRAEYKPKQVTKPSSQSLVTHHSPGNNIDVYTKLPLLTLGKECQVMVSYVESLHLFFGQLCDVDLANKSYEMTLALNKYCTESVEKSYQPSANELCCGFDGDCWYRVFTVELKDDAVKAYFIDYGNHSHLDFTMLRRCPTEFVKMPSLAIPLKFYNEKLLVNSDENLELLKTKIENKIMTINLVSDSKKEKEIKLLDENGSDIFESLQSISGQGAVNDVVNTQFDCSAECESKQNTEPTRESVVNDALSEIDIYTKLPLITISNECQMMISYVESLNLFFGQLCDVDLASKSYEMTLELNKYCTESAGKSYRPSLNELCCGFDGDCWYRVFTVELKDDAVKAYFIDYGNHSHLDFTMLRRCPTEFVTMPSLAIPLKFYNEKLLVNSDENLELLKTKIENKIMTINLISDSKVEREVILFDENGSDIFESLHSLASHEKVNCEVNTLLDSSAEYAPEQIIEPTEESLVISTSLGSNIDLYTKLPLLTVSNECQIMVTHVESLNLFFGQLCDVDLASKVYELTLLINDYCTDSDEKYYRPSANELCCGFDGDCWYRVFIVELKDDVAKAYFIDYGNHSHLNINMLRRCPIEFVKLPSLAIPLKMYNSELLVDSDENLEQLKTKIENKILAINVISDNGKEREVKLFEENGVNIYESLQSNIGREVVSSVVDIASNCSVDGGSKQITIHTTESSIADSPSDIDIHTKRPSFTVVDQCQMLITYVMSFDLFYGQLCDADTASKSYEMTLALNKYCTESTEKTYMPSVNELCCGFDGECWYRVSVVELNGDVVKTYFIDYGNYSHLSFNMLRPCPIDFLKVASLAIPLKLYDRMLLVDSDENLELLKTKIENKIVCINLMSNNEKEKEVKLIDENGSDISESLQSIANQGEDISVVDTALNCIADCESKQIIERSETSVIDKHIDIYTNFPGITVADQCQVLVTHVESLNLFYGQLYDVDSASKICEMTLALNEYCAGCLDENYMPSVNELCCGFVEEDSWYRVSIVELMGDKAKVYFVDYGYHSYINRSMLRSYPIDILARIPSLAIRLKLYDCERFVNSDENLKLLKSKIENEILDIHVMSGNLLEVVEVKLNDENAKNIFDTLQLRVGLDQSSALASVDISELAHLVGEVEKRDGIRQDGERTSNIDNCQAHASTSCMSDSSNDEGITVVKCDGLHVSKHNIGKSSVNSIISLMDEPIIKDMFTHQSADEGSQVNRLEYKSLLPSREQSSPSKEKQMEILSRSQVVNSTQFHVNGPHCDNIDSFESSLTESSNSKDKLEGNADGNGKNDKEKSVVLSFENKSQVSSSSETVEKIILTDGLDQIKSENIILSRLPSNINPLESVSMKMNVASLSPNKVAFLRITHVVSPYLTYGLILEELPKLETLQEEISLCFDDSSISDFKLRAGFLYCWKESNEKCRRVVLTAVKKDECDIFLIDRGDTSTVPLSSLKPLAKKYKILPAQAIPLKLASVKPMDGGEKWFSDAIEYFRGIVDDQTVRVLPKSKEGFKNNVKLKLHPNGELVDKLFVAGGYAVGRKPDVVITSERSEELSLLNAGSNKLSSESKKKFVPFGAISQAIKLEKVPDLKYFEVLVTCVISPRLFYARLYDPVKFRRVDDMGSLLRKLYEKHQAPRKSLVKGELCAARNGDSWYRGYIIDIHQNTNEAIVWLIDYGFREFFSQDYLWPLPADMKSFPGQAFTMQLHHIKPSKNSEKYSDLALKEFKLLTAKKLVNVEVRLMNGFIHRVVIYDRHTGVDIGDHLVRRGFADYIFKPRSTLKSDSTNLRSDSSDSKLFSERSYDLENDLNKSTKDITMCDKCRCNVSSNPYIQVEGTNTYEELGGGITNGKSGINRGSDESRPDSRERGYNFVKRNEEYRYSGGDDRSRFDMENQGYLRAIGEAEPKSYNFRRDEYIRDIGKDGYRYSRASKGYYLDDKAVISYGKRGHLNHPFNKIADIPQLQKGFSHAMCNGVPESRIDHNVIPREHNQYFHDRFNADRGTWVESSAINNRGGEYEHELVNNHRQVIYEYGHESNGCLIDGYIHQEKYPADYPVDDYKCNKRSCSNNRRAHNNFVNQRKDYPNPRPLNNDIYSRGCPSTRGDNIRGTRGKLPALAPSLGRQDFQNIKNYSARFSAGYHDKKASKGMLVTRGELPRSIGKGINQINY